MSVRLTPIFCFSRLMEKYLLGFFAYCLLAAPMNGSPSPLEPSPSGTPSIPSAGPIKPVDVPFEQRLDQLIPLDVPFTDQSGRKVILRDLVGSVPVVLVMGYYECPMLCGLVEKGLMESLNSLTLDLGRDYRVITVSIDPRESSALASGKQASALRMYDRGAESADWTFLVGEESSIKALSTSIGFNFMYDPRSGQWAHPAGIVVLTPEGRTSRYFYGIEYRARDLRLGLVEAAKGSIGGLVDQFQLLCYGYDPATGKYSFTIMRALRFAGAITLFLIFFLIAFLRRSEKRLKQLEGGL